MQTNAAESHLLCDSGMGRGGGGCQTARQLGLRHRRAEMKERVKVHLPKSRLWSLLPRRAYGRGSGDRRKSGEGPAGGRQRGKDPAHGGFMGIR